MSYQDDQDKQIADNLQQKYNKAYSDSGKNGQNYIKYTFDKLGSLMKLNKKKDEESDSDNGDAE